MIAAANKQKSILQLLNTGGVILAPTDTVWGLICDFENAGAIGKILKLKRSNPRPLALLCSDWRNLKSFGLLMPDYATRLAEKFWPGPMTLVLKSESERIQLVTGEANSIGIRMPNAADLLDLIAEFGKPVAATSANFTGQEATANFDKIPDEIKAGVTHIWDFQITPSGVASTVIDCTGPNHKIIRHGKIEAGDIAEAAKA